MAFLHVVRVHVHVGVPDKVEISQDKPFFKLPCSKLIVMDCRLYCLLSWGID